MSVFRKVNMGNGCGGLPLINHFKWDELTCPGATDDHGDLSLNLHVSYFYSLQSLQLHGL